MADGVQVPFAGLRLRKEVMPHGESDRAREAGDRTSVLVAAAVKLLSEARGSHDHEDKESGP